MNILAPRSAGPQDPAAAIRHPHPPGRAESPHPNRLAALNARRQEAEEAARRAWAFDDMAGGAAADIRAIEYAGPLSAELNKAVTLLAGLMEMDSPAGSVGLTIAFDHLDELSFGGGAGLSAATAEAVQRAVAGVARIGGRLAAELDAIRHHFAAAEYDE